MTSIINPPQFVSDTTSPRHQMKKSPLQSFLLELHSNHAWGAILDAWQRSRMSNSCFVWHFMIKVVLPLTIQWTPYMWPQELDVEKVSGNWDVINGVLNLIWVHFRLIHVYWFKIVQLNGWHLWPSRRGHRNSLCALEPRSWVRIQESPRSGFYVCQYHTMLEGFIKVGSV